LSIQEEIRILKERLDAVLVAHFYQRDEIVEIADITGDSLELAKRAMGSPRSLVVFCGVGFMGQSVKILAPQKRVVMPRLACCSMARMIDSAYFDESIQKLEEYGLLKEAILPLTYINSSAEVKAKVGAMGGLVCTSANAVKIMQKAQESGKKNLLFARSMSRAESCQTGRAKIGRARKQLQRGGAWGGYHLL